MRLLSIFAMGEFAKDSFHLLVVECGKFTTFLKDKYYSLKNFIENYFHNKKFSTKNFVRKLFRKTFENSFHEKC